VTAFRAALLLAFLGSVRMAADLAGLAPVAALAAASGAAPAPKVFSSVAGLETFSSRFFLEWEDAAGEAHSVEVTAERAARLAGPYNRRNVYGAALAYGPVLASDPRTRPLLSAVLRGSLCGDAPLLAELGVETPGRVGPVRVRVAARQRPAGATWPSVLEEACR
jgi:hypothetical protein